MIKYIDAKLVKFEWIPFAYGTNTGVQTQKKKAQCQHDCKITGGQDVDNNVDFLKAFEGLKFQVNNDNFYFDKVNIRDTTTLDVSYKIEPRKTVLIYQKRYSFDVAVWFAVKNKEGKLYPVGDQFGGGVSYLNGSLEINSGEYTTEHHRLGGENGTMVTEDVRREIPNIKELVMLKDLSGEIKDYLSEHGLSDDY